MEYEDEDETALNHNLSASGDFDEAGSKSILKSVMQPQMHQLGMAQDSSSQEPGAPGSKGEEEIPDPKRKDKVKPMSRKMTGCISQCSAKLTEILAWQSKLDENKNGLTLSQL
ncbi:unnamed protein product [Durusdinium trenchii]|uniref:Uncharacterized protein n=1 Tax=Durusdinium trenchii TaxID=1381693 RepID=A0ABP0HYH3_9DINO